MMLVLLAPDAIGLATHNRLVALEQRCETAFADLDVERVAIK